MTTLALSACAVIVHPDDNVAVVKNDIDRGVEVEIEGGTSVILQNDGTETIDSVGARLFEHIRRVGGGDVLAKAEVHKHREFQIWAEQSVSL